MNLVNTTCSYVIYPALAVTGCAVVGYALAKKLEKQKTDGGGVLELTKVVAMTILGGVKEIAPFLITTAIATFVITHTRSYLAERELLCMDPDLEIGLHSNLPGDLTVAWRACNVPNSTSHELVGKFGVTLMIVILVEGVFLL